MLATGHRIPDDLPGHAQEFETAVALARLPENVRHDAMATQSDASPSAATRELGEIMLGRVVQRVSRYVEEMIDGRRSQPVPPFHP